jgi:hypothetical protein
VIFLTTALCSKEHQHAQACMHACMRWCSQEQKHARVSKEQSKSLVPPGSFQHITTLHFLGASSWFGLISALQEIMTVTYKKREGKAQEENTIAHTRTAFGTVVKRNN